VSEGLTSERPKKLSDRLIDVDFVSLQHMLQFFRENVATIAAPVAIALAAMIVYLALTQPIYRADAQLLIDGHSPQLFGEQFGETGSRLDNASVESQLAILRSEQLALSVLKKTDLPAPSHAPKSSAPDPSQIRQAVKTFQDGLRVRRMGIAYVIEVSFYSIDREEAERFADATIEAYIDDQVTSRGRAARQGSKWLEERIDELRVQMNATALKMQEFKAKRDYRIISKGEGGLSPEQQATVPTKPATNTLEELESTASTYRKIYESYLQAYTESVQRQSYPLTNARIIARAIAVQSHPRVFLLLLVALAAGATIGLGIALIGGPLLPLIPWHKLVGASMILRERWRSASTADR
jgi:uncharacterized protein involved in exopolysaccharide biosynthesis